MNGADWQSLAQAAAQVPLIVIANVNSGPGTATLSAEWINAFAAVQAAGGKVIGYVHTSRGARPMSTVLADVQAWYAQYPRLDGIFLDEAAQTATPAALSYFQNLSAQIRATHPQSLIVANPGGDFDQAFMQNNTADIFVRHEDMASTVDAHVAPAWMQSVSASRFAQIKLAAANDASEARFAAGTPAVGWVYSTTAAWQGGNPYAELPADFAQMVQTIARINQGDLTPSQAATCFGVGDRLNWMETSTDFQSTPTLLRSLGFPAENQLVAIWLDENWNTAYFNGIQPLMNQGMVPVFVYYFEGDLARYGQNAWAHVQQTQGQWLADAQRFGQFLATLQGTALVVIQPEWNIPTLQDNAQFGQLLGQVAQTIRAAQGNARLRLRIGTAVGDFGNYTLVQDPYWASFKPAMTAALPQLDFIGFQEMAASTHLNESEQLQIYTAEQEGLPTPLPQRTVELAKFLQSNYGKPILIPYVEIASYTPSGSTENWTQLSAQAYADILAQRAALQQAGVFGVMAMSLFDDLSHNNAGTDYFGPASLTYGLVQSNGSAGSSQIGTAPYTLKPSATAWMNGTNAATSGNAVCAIP
jgi:hypothetical protein